MPLALVVFLIFLVNLPFGFWRARVPRRSVPWFAAIHLPVPIIIALRVFSGLGFHWSSLPFTVTAYFLGQLVGGLLGKWLAPPPPRMKKPPT